MNNSKIKSYQAKISQLNELKRQLKAQIQQQTLIYESLKLQKGSIGTQVSNPLWIQMRSLNEENYHLVSNINTDLKSPKIFGATTLRINESCKEQTIKMLTAKLNQLRTVLDKMQNNPLNPILSSPILMNPTNRSVQVNHLIQQNQQLVGKMRDLQFQQNALKDGIKRMKGLLFEKMKDNIQKEPDFRYATLDKDFYSLQNLAPRPEPINIIEETLKRQPPLSQKPSEQIVRLADNYQLIPDIVTPLAMPIPTAFGKGPSMGQLLFKNGAVNMVQYSDQQKQSRWQNFKSMLLSYSPWGNSVRG